MDFRSSLARVQCPVLVLAGREDPITPVECSEQILASLPRERARLIVYETCGHGAFRDDPVRVYADIRSFLKSL